MNNIGDPEENQKMNHEEILGDWLYPKARGDTTLWSDEAVFFHCQYQTSDTFDEIGQYYFKKLSPSQSFRKDGGSTYYIGEDQRWLFRYSPPNYQYGVASTLLVTHANDERTISIVVVPAVEIEGYVLLITFEAHKWK